MRRLLALLLTLLFLPAFSFAEALPTLVPPAASTPVPTPTCTPDPTPLPTPSPKERMDDYVSARFQARKIVGGAVIIGFTLWQNGIFYAEVGAWIGAAILLSIAYYRHVAKLGK